MTRFSDKARRRWQSRPTGWVRRPRGATVVEYLVVLVLGVLILVGAMQVFGGGINNQLQNATDFLAAAVDGDEDRRGTGGERTSSSGRDSGERGASASGSGDSSGDGAVYVDDDGRQVEAIAGGQREETDGSVGGVNPLVIILLIAGVLFLGYIVFRED